MLRVTYIDGFNQPQHRDISGERWVADTDTGLTHFYGPDQKVRLAIPTKRLVSIETIDEPKTTQPLTFVPKNPGPVFLGGGTMDMGGIKQRPSNWSSENGMALLEPSDGEAIEPR